MPLTISTEPLLTGAHFLFLTGLTMDESHLPLLLPIPENRHRCPYVRSGFVYGTVLILVALQFLYSHHTLTIVHTTSSVPIHAEHPHKISCARHRTWPIVTLLLLCKFRLLCSWYLGYPHPCIWTGGQNGTEIIKGHIYFDKGIFEGVGGLDVNATKMLHNQDRLDIVDVKGVWMMPV